MTERPPFEPFRDSLGMVFLLAAPVKLEAQVDLVRLIRENLDEYARVDLRGGFMEWERPLLFLIRYVEGYTEIHIGDGDYIRETPWSGEIDWSATRWTEMDYDQLVRVCPEADLRNRPISPRDSDPNQMMLPEEDA